MAEKKACLMEQRLIELENYSRRWNLRLYGVPETKDQNVRRVVIEICQSIPPEHKTKFSDVIDTVHRLGQPRKEEFKPRGIILQFTLCIYRDAVWKAAKSSTFLHNKHLRFAEDLSQSVGERELFLTGNVICLSGRKQLDCVVSSLAISLARHLLPFTANNVRTGSALVLRSSSPRRLVVLLKLVSIVFLKLVTKKQVSFPDNYTAFFRLGRFIAEGRDLAGGIRGCLSIRRMPFL